jgi:hypothetical protein
MYSKDCSIRPGQSITIEVSNKPYADQTIPPESNDYRWADSATIEIWDTETQIIVSDTMSVISNRPGWYTYRFQTTEDMVKGVYRVVVRLTTAVSGTGTTGSTGTSGTSGNPSSETMTDVKVSYFRLMDLY